MSGSSRNRGSTPVIDGVVEAEEEEEVDYLQPSFAYRGTGSPPPTSPTYIYSNPNFFQLIRAHHVLYSYCSTDVSLRVTGCSSGDLGNMK